MSTPPERRELPNQSGRRKLSAQEVDVFFQDRPDIFEHVSDNSLRIQRRRMIELFAGGFGLVQSEFPRTPGIYEIKNARISAVRQDVEELSEVFGQNLQPLFASEKAVSLISGIRIGLPSSQTLIAVEGGRLTDQDLVISEDVPTGDINPLLDSLVKATALDRATIQNFAKEIFTMRGGQASAEIEEEDEETIVPTPSPEPVIDPIDREGIGGRLRQALEATSFDVRDHQFDMLSSITEGIENGMGRMGIFAATGSGKTRVMREFARVADVPTLIVVPTQVILQQTVAEMKSAGLRVGTYYSRGKDTFTGSLQTRKQVIVTTYDSFSRDNFAISPQSVGALIFDEAHKVLGRKTYRKMTEYNHSLQLAFTASPDYSPERTIRGIFPRVYERNAAEYARKGILSPFSVWIATTKLDLTTVSVDGLSGEYNEIKLAQAAEKAGIADVAAALYKQQFASDGKSAIAYCVGVTHARHTAETFNQNGIAAAYVSGETPYEERAEILGKFKSGEIKVLCNAELLTVGFDEPHAQVALNLRPTRSIVTAVQRAGRVLRLDPDNQAKIATIVDFMPETGKFIQNRPPISYAEVVGTARAFPGQEQEEGQDLPQIRRGRGQTITEQSAMPSFTLQDGTVVVTSMEEVMRIGEGFTEYDTAHSGEMNMWQLSQHLQLPSATIARRIPALLMRYLREHEAEDLQPESVIIQRKTGRGVLPHYTGDFIAFFEQTMRQIKETGRSIPEFAKKHNITDSSVYSALEGYEAWARERGITENRFEQADLAAVGRSERQLSESAVQFLLETRGYDKREIVKKDDPRKNLREMHEQFGVSKGAIETALKNILGDEYQSQGVSGMREGSTKPGIFYDASVVEQVRQKVQIRILGEKDPGMSVAELVTASGKGRTTINRIIAKLPEDMKKRTFRGRRGDGGTKDSEFFEQDVADEILGRAGGDA